MTNPPTVPSNASQSIPVSAPQPAPQGDPRIKAEPTYDNPVSNYPQNPYTNGGSGMGGHQRAAELLRQQYGPQASASIGALQQQGLHLPGRGPAGPPLHRPQGDPASNQQYLREQEQMRQQPREIANAQTDGPGDEMGSWNALVAERRAQHNIMRAHAEQLAQQMDAGLMTPRVKSKKAENRKRHAQLIPPSSSSTATSIVQLDGPNDVKEEDAEREELDEDAINSDLDDSGDDLNQDDDDDEGNSGEVMLCTYDKVARVKNKWKCTLKDGVLTTGGKE